MRQRLSLSLLCVLILAGCGASRSGVHKTTTSTAVSHATASEEAAARQATVGSRTLVTQAGQRLAEALGTEPPNIAAARNALDEVRMLLPRDPQGRSDLDRQLSGVTSSPLLTVSQGSLASITLLLSHVVRSPSAIAGLARFDSEWVESRAPEIAKGTSPFTQQDLVTVIHSAQAVLEDTAALGVLVASDTLSRSQRDMANLEKVVRANGSLRATMAAANASIRSLSLYETALLGYGVSSVDP